MLLPPPKNMEEHVVGRHSPDESKTPVSTRRLLSCRCFHCSAFSARVPCHKTHNIGDWEIGTDSCCGGFCTSQPRCAHPDRDECEIGRSSKGKDPLIYYGWDKQAPNLKCIYNLDKIDTRAQVLAYKDKFGENNDIEAKYCTQKITTCPKGMKECSRLKSIGEGGNECRMWFERQPTHIQNATIQNYCLRHNTEDCKCINRADNSAYQAMKGAHSINDGCWYTACANRSGKYLVPTQLANPTCPDKMCQVLFDIVEDGNVSIDHVQNDIVCKFDRHPSDPSKPLPPKPHVAGPPDPLVPKPAKPDKTFLDFAKLYKYEMFAISILLIVLIVIVTQF